MIVTEIMWCAAELLAAGVKSTDSACEASGEPSGAMGGVVVKQEDSATGEGTCGAVYSSHKHGMLSTPTNLVPHLSSDKQT